MPATAARPRRAPKSSTTPGFADRLNRFWSRPGVKIGAWVIFVLVWIPFLAAISMVIGINPIFNRQVEKLGEKALRVPVRLHRASVSFSGKLSLGHFTIANPPGFVEEEAASFDGLYAAVPLRSLFRQEIDLPVLTVLHPVFNLELGSDGKPSNWAVLMKNLAESLPKKNEPTPPDGDKKFKIGALKIIDPVIHFRSSAFPDGILLDLKDVELKKVGNAPDSSTKTYIVLASILQAILTGGIKEGKDLPRSVSGSIKEELSEAGKAFGDVLKEIK